MTESLYSKTKEELKDTLGLEKAFKASIVYDALTKGVKSFDDITSLSLSEREYLKEKFKSPRSSEVLKMEEEDSSVKILIRLSDGMLIEAVRLSDGKGRETACLSSQVGCLMGCAFCRTGEMGFKRNLSKGEIIEELFHLRDLGKDIDNIVFMGMGEPLLNYDELIGAIHYFHDPKGLNMSYRRITVSTCGIIPGIRRLRDENIPVRLAVSLTSGDEYTRAEIMPVERRYHLRHLKTELVSYQRSEGKRVTIEYTMIKGVNTDRHSAVLLKDFLRGMDTLVNLIPLNEGAKNNLKTPSKREIDDFLSYLDDMEIKYTIRLSKGRSTNAACGLLATEDDY